MLVGSHVRGVATLGDDASLGPDGAEGVHLLGAVRLVVVLALAALEARPRLGADADALAGLDQGDLGADAQGLADDLVADGQGEVLVAPASGDRVDVAAADAARLDLDLYIIVAKGLHVKLVLVELGPGVGRLDLETGILVVLRHDGRIDCNSCDIKLGSCNARRIQERERE